MSIVKLSAQNLSIGYSQRASVVVSEDLAVELRAGELVCLLGPNGAGKSTLMRTLAGLLPAFSGEVFIGEDRLADLTPQVRALRLSLVLTDRIDAGNMSVSNLVALGRYPHTGWLGKMTPEDLAVVQQSLVDTGAEWLADRSVAELSDGERQKVMIARALAQESEIVFLDEPTAFLDLPRRVEIMHLLRQLAHNGNRAILLSTHDLDLALRCADRLWLLSQEGDLVCGMPEDLVLSGDLEKTFSNKAIVFDAMRGVFQAAPVPGYKIGVRGSGIAASWTQRALVRMGFEVTDTSQCLLCVEVCEEENRMAWRVTGGTQDFECESLEELSGFLQKITAKEMANHS